MREAIAGVTQRQVETAAFEDADELAAFLRRVGFHVVVRIRSMRLQRCIITALGLSPVLVDRFRPVLRVWVMTPTLQPERRPSPAFVQDVPQAELGVRLSLSDDHADRYERFGW